MQYARRINYQNDCLFGSRVDLVNTGCPHRVWLGNDLKIDILSLVAVIVLTLQLRWGASQTLGFPKKH